MCGLPSQLRIRMVLMATDTIALVMQYCNRAPPGRVSLAPSASSHGMDVPNHSPSRGRFPATPPSLSCFKVEKRSRKREFDPEQ